MMFNRKLLAALVFSTIAGMAANSWAETAPLEMTANGLSETAKGVATTVSTPLVMLENLAEGNLPEAAGSAVVLPVKGIVNTAAGTVMVVSGIGRGATGLLGQAFQATGNFAEQSLQPVKNNLP